MKAQNLSTGVIIADQVEVAKTLITRLKGLLGRDSLPKGSGLLIQACKGVHTFGMKFPIDIIFLNSASKVVSVRRNTPPNCLTRIHLSAVSVLELPAGTLDSLMISQGDIIDLS